jgi:hypothetical protein
VVFIEELERGTFLGPPVSLVLAIGDDRSDEEMLDYIFFILARLCLKICEIFFRY